MKKNIILWVFIVLAVAQAVLLILKLCGHINAQWFLVLLPAWAPVALFVIGVTGVCCAIVVEELKKDREYEGLYNNKESR